MTRSNDRRTWQLQHWRFRNKAEDARTVARFGSDDDYNCMLAERRVHVINLMHRCIHQPPAMLPFTAIGDDSSADKGGCSWDRAKRDRWAENCLQATTWLDHGNRCKFSGRLSPHWLCVVATDILLQYFFLDNLTHYTVSKNFAYLIYLILCDLKKPELIFKIFGTKYSDNPSL